MGKMNYSNFEDDEVEIIPEEAIEVLPQNISYNLSNKSQKGKGQALANAISPVAAITDCINTVLGVVSTFSQCHAVISIEKQRTVQIKAKVEAEIAESMQQTERVKIHEKEKTKRLIETCKSNLKIKKLELEKLRDEYQYKNNERIISHNEYIKTLNLLENQIDGLMKDKELLREMIFEESNNREQVENFLHSLNEANISLIEISKQLVLLRGK